MIRDYLNWAMTFIAILGLAGTSLVTAVTAVAQDDEEVPKRDADAIRCVVIGGMTQSDFFQAVATRFEKQSGRPVRIEYTGPKHAIAERFIESDADLITMHASDTIINLVANGFAADAQPWARNDMLLVGPPSDPAKIKGEKNAVTAMAKIIESKSKYLVHASAGTGEVLRGLLDEGELELDPEHTLSLPVDRHRQFLEKVVKEEAYTLVGRIPFLNAKLPQAGAQIMVQGDPRLRRPYLVAVTSRQDDVRAKGARDFAAFLRSPETQDFIATFGRGDLDDQPLFFPVHVPRKK
jgi:tungstate transport system substrate-binding protein